MSKWIRWKKLIVIITHSLTFEKMGIEKSTRQLKKDSIRIGWKKPFLFSCTNCWKMFRFNQLNNHMTKHGTFSSKYYISCETCSPTIHAILDTKCKTFIVLDKHVFFCSIFVLFTWIELLYFLLSWQDGPYQQIACWCLKVALKKVEKKLFKLYVKGENLLCWAKNAFVVSLFTWKAAFNHLSECNPFIVES